MSDTSFVCALPASRGGNGLALLIASPDSNSVSATEFGVLEFISVTLGRDRAMPTTTRYTSADLKALPDDGRRYEIIDGELYVSKQPRYHHQYTCGRIHKFLDNWIDSGGHGRAIVAPGVIFTDDNDVVPDVVWISDARLRSILGSDGHLHGAPEIAIEVLSPGSANALRDRETKRDLYARRAVQEYWVIDWMVRRVEVYRRCENALELAGMLSGNDDLTSPLLTGFACRIGNLFDELFQP